MSACAHGMPSKGACVECMYDEGLGAAPTTPVTVEAVFAARYDGSCPACHTEIHIGQRLAKLSNDRYVHEGCA